MSLNLVKSSDYSQALNDTQLTELIENNPTYHFLKPSTVTLYPQLSAHAIMRLSEMGVYEAQLERSRRMLQDGKLEYASKYAEQLFGHWPLLLQSAWLIDIVESERFELLQALAESHALPIDYRNLVLLANQDKVNAVPTQLKDRLHLNPQQHFDTECVKTIQVIVDSLEGMLNAEHLINQFNNSPEPFERAFCFSVPLYSNQDMQCKKTKEGFATCQIHSDLAVELQQANADYQMIMTEFGLANVVGDVMTLNYSSDYPVLLHELMHFSGFEDEYAFVPEKAQQRCKQKGFIAPNLYVGHALDAPPGWSQNASCKHGALSSFRPASGWTILEYHSMPLSSAYRSKWARLLLKESNNELIYSERIFNHNEKKAL